MPVTEAPRGRVGTRELSAPCRPADRGAAWTVPHATDRPMSAKITFNGQTYDGLESMPPDVRVKYQAILDALGTADREKLEAAMGSGAGLRINTTVRRKIRLNGQDYDSVDAMPADIRAAYERAVAGKEAARVGATTSEMPSPPPAIDASDSRRGNVLRVALLVAVGLAALGWILLRH
jgi:hypothetical protein